MPSTEKDMLITEDGIMLRLDGSGKFTTPDIDVQETTDKEITGEDGIQDMLKHSIKDISPIYVTAEKD
jgi:hypothetical protein